MVILIKENNNLTQAQLFGIAQMAINSGRETINIGKLHDYKDKYIPALFDTMQANLDAAKLKETAVEIRIDHVIDRIDLVELGLTCCGNVPKLKGYIKDGFPKSQQAALYEVAGGHDYPGAMNQNWNSVTSMNTAMVHFTTNPEKLAALLLNNNMKVPSPAKIITDSDAFELGHSTFLTARQSGVKTNEKITADNLVYTNLVDLCADAHISMAGFPELQKLFVIATLKDIVSPPGSASYKVDAKLAVAFTQVSGLTIKIQEAGEPAITLVTGPTGIVHFPNINPAKYTVTISGPGIIALTYKKEVDTGTNAHNEVIVQPVPPPPPPVVEPPVV